MGGGKHLGFIFVRTFFPFPNKPSWPHAENNPVRECIKKNCPAESLQIFFFFFTFLILFFFYLFIFDWKC